MKSAAGLAVVIGLAIGATAVPAAALTQLQTSVQNDLRDYGFHEVDVTQLSTAQLAAIHSIAHSRGREGGKRAMIRSTLGGPDTLRSLFGLRN